MKLERLTFAAVIGKVSPAIASADVIPVFACICFRKDSVHAFDDVACLEFPAKLGLVGAVRGNLLTGFVSSAKSKEIDVIQKGETISFRAGRNHFETTLLPESEFQFEQPTLEDGITIDITTEFLGALTNAALSMGRDASQTWRYGITIVPVGSGFVLYASDDKTIARTKVGIPKGDSGTPILLPPRFVDLLLMMAKNDVPKQLSMAAEWGLVTFKSGLKLFGKSVVGVDPGKFIELFGKIEAKAREAAVEIPEGIEACLDNSMLVVKYSRDPYVHITAGDGRLRFETKSDAGDIKGSVPCEMGEVDILVPPDLVKRGLPFAKKIAILPECVYLSAKNYVFLAATITSGAVVGKENGE